MLRSILSISRLQYLAFRRSWLTVDFRASTDDFAGQLTNMTSLAVKGTVGIGCMGALAALLNNTEDATYYTDLSKQYGAEVIASAMASTNDHMKLTYNSPDDTWSSLYNMLPDKVFNLGIFNDSTYQMQAEWYSKQAREFISVSSE